MNVGPAAIAQFETLLYGRTGQILARDRHYRIEASLTPLARKHGLASVDALAEAYRTHPSIALADDIVDALLNHETSFFRDVPAFDLLEKVVLPDLIARRRAARRLAIWCAGVSTGQEAYSLAMLLADQPELADWQIDLIGTDVSPRAIERARRATYSQFEIQRGLQTWRLVRFATRSDDGFTLSDGLRRSVRFQVRDLLGAPPPARFDLILCRNVLIYFGSTERRIVFERLASGLAGDGVLLLGASETAIGQGDLLESVKPHCGLYRRSAPAARRSPVAMDRGLIGADGG